MQASLMQRPDDKKRGDIIAVASKLFATRPFHEVQMEEVAAGAKIGKGTIYIYFRSKEDLLASIVREGMAMLVENLRRRIEIEKPTAWQALQTVVRDLCAFAVERPHLFQIMRDHDLRRDPKTVENRRALGQLLEQILRRGVRGGEFTDPHPELTAQFIPGCVRSSILYGPERLSPKVLAKHVLRMVAPALGVKGEK